MQHRAVIAFAASAVSVSAAIFTSADGSSTNEVTAHQNPHSGHASSTVGSFSSLSQHLVAEVSSYLHPSSLNSLRATDRKLARLNQRAVISLNTEYSLKYINNEDDFRTKVNNRAAVDGRPIQFNLNTEYSLKYITDENFRSEVNHKCSDLKSRIRLNLGANFQNYFEDGPYRQQVDSLVEDPEKQIWSDLEELDLSYTLVTELTPLAGLTNLKELDLSGTPVTELTPLAGLTNLQKLWLINTPVTEFKPLASLTNLKELNLFGTQVTELTPLAGLANLKELSLSLTPVTKLKPLARLTNLEILTLSYTQVRELKPLARLTNLQDLYLYGTQVEDRHELNHLQNLKIYG